VEDAVPAARPPAAPEALLRRLGRYAVRTVVILFVTWQLFFLAFRNPLDLWKSQIEGWCAKQRWWKKVEKPYEALDKVTTRYGNLLGIEQGWTMFTPPLARSAPFLGARLQFADGSEEVLRSPNEPDVAGFLRLGGWRQRKLEDSLVHASPEELPWKEDLPLYQAYARWCVQRWKEAHPDDRRDIVRVVLLRRRIYFPELGHDPSIYEDPYVVTVGEFDAAGRLP
jgi:hypothetical protein